MKCNRFAKLQLWKRYVIYTVIGKIFNIVYREITFHACVVCLNSSTFMLHFYCRPGVLTLSRYFKLQS